MDDHTDTSRAAIIFSADAKFWGLLVEWGLQDNENLDREGGATEEWQFRFLSSQTNQILSFLRNNFVGLPRCGITPSGEEAVDCTTNANYNCSTSMFECTMISIQTGTRVATTPEVAAAPLPVLERLVLDLSQAYRP